MRFDSRSSCVEIQFLTHVEKFLTPAELDPGSRVGENSKSCTLDPFWIVRIVYMYTEV